MQGIQQYIGACVKHYAANNIEDGRGSANAIIDEETLHEKYGRHFEHDRRRGRRRCGDGLVQRGQRQRTRRRNRRLLTDMLRTEFGFQGFVLTDWWAMNGSSAPIVERRGPPLTPGPGVGQRGARYGAPLALQLPRALHPGRVRGRAAGLDPACVTSTERILEQKYRFHADQINGFGTQDAVHDAGFGSAASRRTTRPIRHRREPHGQLAEHAAEEGMVLLKNDNNTLPISRSTVKKIAIIGATVTYSLQETSCQDCTVDSGNINCSTRLHHERPDRRLRL